MLILSFISVILVVSPDTLYAKNQNYSSLELLAHEFQALSRISNAISLQASAIHKTINSREVIAELLQIATEEFSTIMSVDTESSISTLKKLVEDSKTLPESSLFSGDDLEEIEKRFEQVDGWMSHGFEKNLDHSDLVRAMDQLMTTTERLKYDCQNFDDLLDIVKTPDLYRDGYGFEQYKNDLKAYLNCFKEVINLNKKIESVDFWKTLRKYTEPLNAVKNLLTELKQLEIDIPEIKKDLQLTKALWKTKNTTGFLVSQIEKAFFAHQHHTTSDQTLLPTATVSFLEPKDMLKVPKDLESPFFKKYFVQKSNKHLQKLKSWLKPFHTTSEAIQGLHKLWNPFSKLQHGNVLNSVSTNLNFYEREVAKLVPSSVDKSTAVLSKCIVEPEPNHAGILGTFLKQEASIEKTKEALNVFKDAVVQFAGNFLEEINMYTYEECFQQVLNFVSHSEDGFISTAQNARQVFRECLSKYQHSVGLETIVEDAGKLQKKKKKILDLYDMIKEVTTTTASGAVPGTPVTFDDVIDSSKVLEMLNCLRENQFQVGDLLNATSFIDAVDRFPSFDKLITTISYMESLAKIQSSLSVVEKMMIKTENRTKRSAESSFAFQSFSGNSAEDLGVCTLALLDLVEVQKHRKELSEIKGFVSGVQKDLKSNGLAVFTDVRYNMKKLLKQTDKVEKQAKEFRKTDNVLTMADIFEKVSAIIGFAVEKQHLKGLIERYEKNGSIEKEYLNNLKLLESTPLNFAIYTSRLKDGKNSVINLVEYFDQVFGRVQKRKSGTTVIYASPFFIVGFCMATAFLSVIGGLMIYGCTARGRQKYHNLYLYYFGKQADFEKRWRYSSFADEQDGKNTLLDAVREVNTTNLMIALKRGAYINAYNNFGNTALHAATKGLYPELVEILIRHGADRSLLNVKNRTAEQLIPENYERMQPDKVEKCERIKNIFKKYRKKKFKKCVPLKFPVTSFHIFVEDRTDNELTNHFKDTFESITSIEVSPTTTHLVVKTNPDGVLETDRLDLLFWIFYGAIIVKESWMSDCLDNMKLIEKDFNYLVEKVNYKGVIYDTVLPWSNSMAKSEIPFLYGVYVAVVMNEYANMQSLTSLVLCQGGVFLDEFPLKKNYRIGSRPYLHANLGPLFIIHDGTTDLNIYKHDKDKMYTLFTEEEFIVFMLKREIIVDMRANPITVSKDEE